MKKNLLPFLLICCAFVSCKKESTTTSELVGNWEWTVDYRNNSSSTPQSTGIQEKLSFSPDQRWIKYQNQVSVESGTYETSVQTQNGRKTNQLILKGGTTPYGVEYYEVHSDTLAFSSGFAGIYGAGVRYYLRAK